MLFVLGRVLVFFISAIFFSILYIFIQNVSTRVDFFVLFFAFQDVPLLLIMFFSALFGFFLQIFLFLFLGLRKDKSTKNLSTDT